MTAEELRQQAIMRIRAVKQMMYGRTGQFKFRFECSIYECSDMPLQVCAQSTCVTKDLPSLPNLEDANVPEPFSDECSSEPLHVRRRYGEHNPSRETNHEDLEGSSLHSSSSSATRSTSPVMRNWCDVFDSADPETGTARAYESPPERQDLAFLPCARRELEL